ncbi:MAG: acyl-CoA thioesterase [Bacillaceae bacterium]|nr:acyl-CoA thioesterase [Bacillaceae bacterium]
MARATFIQPDPEAWIRKFRFARPIQIRFSDTDMLGHVNNVKYFAYYELGRLDYIKELGAGDDLFNMREGKSIVTADLECHYLRQLFYDQTVEVRVRTAKIGRSSLDLEYALVLSDTGDLVAAGRGALVLIDTKTGRSLPIPEETKQKIIRYEDEQVEQSQMIRE